MGTPYIRYFKFPLLKYHFNSMFYKYVDSHFIYLSEYEAFSVAVFLIMLFLIVSLHLFWLDLMSKFRSDFLQNPQNEQ